MLCLLSILSALFDPFHERFVLWLTVQPEQIHLVPHVRELTLLAMAPARKQIVKRFRSVLEPLDRSLDNLEEP